jgi:hypothetical protein
LDGESFHYVVFVAEGNTSRSRRARREGCSKMSNF